MNHEERLSKSLFTRFLHIAWRIAGDIAHRVAERLGTAMPPPFDGLHAIGVDETSHRKGHTYLTVVVDHERHRVIWAHDGVGGDVFDLFFKALTPEQHASIRVVTGDGARWIDPCVGRWRPNAERVLDGFHIVSWMTDALDKVRKRLWNQARRDGDEKTTKRMRGVMKNPGDLTDRQSVFCQVGVGRFGVSFSPCERRVSGRFGVGRSCWLLVIALVIA